MEPLTWTGSLSFLNLFFALALALFAILVVAQLVASLFATEQAPTVHSDGTIASSAGIGGLVSFAMKLSFVAVIAIILIYLIAGVFMGTNAGIFGGIAQQLLPVWIGMIVVFVASIKFKRSLGLYGKLFDSTVGMIGFGLVLFWVLAGIMAGVFDMIVTHDSLSQASGMKNKLPGTPLRGAEEGEYQWYLLGGDNLARDVFSRLFKGAWTVVLIAPFATIFAFMVGITLGLPSGYYGGRLDTFLSFVANLILAFPVIFWSHRKSWRQVSPTIWRRCCLFSQLSSSGSC
jgi:peptide/nickel transport system permease protein